MYFLKHSSLFCHNFQTSLNLNLSKGITGGGTPGAGAGKGGGAGGSVRESGGGLGKFGAAQEEGYFYSKQREQLKKMKKELKEEKDTPKKEE